jgi:hypothetical protein
MPSSGETGAQRTIAYVSGAGSKEIIALGIDVRAGRFEPLDGGDGSLTKNFDGPTGANPNWIEFVSLR